jgi:hypothetical protein
MKITIRECDDWVAIYKDGRKVEENHSCGIRQGLEALGIEFEYQDWYDKVPDDGIMPDGSDPFPEAIE